MGTTEQLDTAVHHVWEVSSAIPGKLLDYSTLGLVLCDELKVRSQVVTAALDSLVSASDPEGLVPSMGEVADQLGDLAGDWYHLDEHVGDVGVGFVKALDLPWNGDRSSLTDVPVIVSDMALAAAGQIGIADRDDAINAAQADAAAIEELFDEDHVSAEDIAAIAALVRRGQYDPAYAVTLANLLGPEGMVDVVGLIEGAYDGGDADHDAGWGLPVLAPFSTVLSTAADTVAATPAGERIDADNDDLAPGRRLDDEWLDDFVDIGLGDDSYDAYHAGLLVSQAALPASAILALANGPTTDRIRRGFEGPPIMATTDALHVWGPDSGTTDANILRGLGNNPHAAAEWLTDTDDGTTNAEALLRYEPGPGYLTHDAVMREVHLAGLGDAASDVFGAGLPLADAEVMGTVIDTVAAEGSLHLPGMEPGLATGAAAHMDLLHERINDDFTIDPASGQGTDDFETTGVFLREVMRSETAALTMATASGELLDATLNGAPSELDLHAAGRTIGAISESRTNAIMSGGLDDDATDSDSGDMVDFLVGMLPGVGSVNDLADGFGDGLGESIFGDSAIDSAGADAQDHTRDLRSVVAIATATHHYEAGAITAESAANAAQANLDQETIDELDIDRATIDSVFYTSPDQPRPTIPPLTELTNAQQAVVRAWVDSPTGISASSSRTGPSAQRGQFMNIMDAASESSGLLAFEF